MTLACPVCSATLNAAAPADRGTPRGPSPGDLTMCLYCGVLLAFDRAGLRLATDAENRGIDADTRAHLEDTYRRFHGSRPVS